jgi:hypothetical protein
MTTQGGYCFQCGTAVEGDIMDHTATHSPAGRKPKTEIKSWQRRLDGVVRAIEEIRLESDRALQVQRLDREVIMELYLVRASLNQKRRNKEG